MTYHAYSRIIPGNFPVFVLSSSNDLKKRFRGLLVSRSLGFPDFRFSGFLVSWFLGFRFFRFCWSPVSWFLVQGFPVSWFPGVFLSRFPGLLLVFRFLNFVFFPVFWFPNVFEKSVPQTIGSSARLV